MNHEQFERYAKLIIRTGANVQPGQKVEINAHIDQIDLAEQVTKAAYEAGARRVEMKWMSDAINRLNFQFADTEELGTVLPWEEERARQMVEDLPVRIVLLSDDPDALSGISPEKLSEVNRMRSTVLRQYREQIDGRHQWVAAGASSPKWAMKVFPGEDEETAAEKLWDAIMKCVYLDSDRDGNEVWKEHNDRTLKKAQWLNEQQFTSLEYKSANGTDFRVGLIPGAVWGGACDLNHENGATYTPNLPTEEVFTTPMRGSAEGTLVSTKPLSWNGQIIDDFSVTYKDGKVASCKAKVGGEILEKMFQMDEGAAMLGEVALVPKESPINRSGLLFYNTLFDENACCHVAAGHGFPFVLDGFLDMTPEELKEKGINDSIIHVDFMVGSEDLNITGYRADGTAVPVFVNGTWAE